MWKKYAGYLKQILPLMKNSLLPVLLLGTALGAYFMLAPFGEEAQRFLHVGFFLSCAASAGILIYFNRNRPLFFVLVLLIAYCLINYLKFAHGIIYNLTADYYNLCFLTAVCFLFFYFLPNRPLFSFDTVNFLIVVFAALALGEQLGRYRVGIDFSAFFCNGCGLQTFGLALFLSVLIIMLVHSSIRDEILTTSLFFATVSVMLGFYLSDRPSPLALFFFTAALTVLCGIIHSLPYAARKDVVTGLDNGNSFIRAQASLPLKYGLGIVCIDDYKHLAQIFKKSGIDEIVVMIAKKICELEPDAHVYRCGADEFIVIFPAAEKGASFARVDNIRRTVAASEFLLSGRKKALKLTVSCSVADKKRSDADVFEVFMRARKILQKTYKFTQNITSQA